jgi:hypothetical protein
VRRQPAALFEAVQRRKERAGADVECPLGDLTDAARNAEPMVRPEGERLQDQQVERAAEQVCLVGQCGLLSSSDMRTPLLSKVNRRTRDGVNFQSPTSNYQCTCVWELEIGSW